MIRLVVAWPEGCRLDSLLKHFAEGSPQQNVISQDVTHLESPFGHSLGALTGSLTDFNRDGEDSKPSAANCRPKRML